MNNCEQAGAIGTATKLILDDKVDVIIGPPCLSGTDLFFMLVQ
jgi:hypothetical protein